MDPRCALIEERGRERRRGGLGATGGDEGGINTVRVGKWFIQGQEIRSPTIEGVL